MLTEQVTNMATRISLKVKQTCILTDLSGENNDAILNSAVSCTEKLLYAPTEILQTTQQYIWKKKWKKKK